MYVVIKLSKQGVVGDSSKHPPSTAPSQKLYECNTMKVNIYVVPVDCAVPWLSCRLVRRKSKQELKQEAIN